jgi:hypothetical protein
LRFSIDGLKSAMGKSNCECRQLFRVLKPIGTMIGMIGALGWLDVREVRLRNNQKGSSDYQNTLFSSMTAAADG